MQSVTEQRAGRFGSRPSVLLSANSFWNIVNFRAPLIQALVDAGYPVRIAAPQADQQWARAHGAEATGIAIDRSGLSPVADAALCWTYLRLFRRERPRFFLGFTAKPNIYGALAARASGVTPLPNVSGLGTAFMREGPLSRFVSYLYRLAFRGCPVVFFQNPDDRDLFVAKKIVRPGQARVLPGSGIDLDAFAARPAPTGDGEPRFLFIGRLLGDKGVREFAEAARLVRLHRPHWRFQLLGDVDIDNRSGIRPEEVRQWVEQGLVEHLGHASDVRPQIAAATAVVLPSYREGLPRSLLEGAAMARPLIATDVPGCRQLVQHGVTGLLCRARDADSLAKAMLELGSLSKEQRDQMGRAARALVEREYGVDRVVEEYLNVLSQLAAEAGV